MTRTPSAGSVSPAPEGAFSLSIKVRSYEVDEAGLIGPGTLLRYLEHLATQASKARGFDHMWYEVQGSAWVVRTMALSIRALPALGQEVEMATWLSTFRRVQAFREYAIWRPATGQLIARAQARWAYVDRERGQILRIPDVLVNTFGVLGHAMPYMKQLGATSNVQPPDHARYSLRARRYEMDSQLHVNNCVYVDWLDEALRWAVQSRCDAVPATLRPRAFLIEYAAPTRAGDEVKIETDWACRGSRGIAATQHIVGPLETNLVRASSLYLRCPRAATR